MLIECGADVNKLDIENNTPLTYATGYGHGTLQSLLLKHGADPELEGKQKMMTITIPNNVSSGKLFTITIEGTDVTLVSPLGSIAGDKIQLNRFQGFKIEICCLGPTYC